MIVLFVCALASVVAFGLGWITPALVRFIFAKKPLESFLLGVIDIGIAGVLLWFATGDLVITNALAALAILGYLSRYGWQWMLHFHPQHQH